jgi:hypothetical protein
MEAEVGIRRDLPVLFGTPYLSHHYFFEKVHMPCHLPYSASSGLALPFEGHDFAFYHVLEKLFLQSAMQFCGKNCFEPGVNIAIRGAHAWSSRHRRL